jgi:hypothetical protein
MMFWVMWKIGLIIFGFKYEGNYYQKENLIQT